MKTILVPVDFSDTSKNAAIYALNLASVLGAKTIILYHAFQATSSAAPLMVADTSSIPITALPLMDIDAIQEISINNIKYLKQSIQSFCPPGVVIEEKAEYDTLDDIDGVCKNTGADLIVMGVTGLGKIEEVLMGSMAISVVKTTKVPVIVVPAEAKYATVKNIMLASDFKKVAETMPLQLIRSFLNATNAKLYVLNIFEGDKEISSDKTYQKELLNSLLKEYKPEIYFESNDSFMNGINDFVETNRIDMIITIPKRHSFFEGLFKERHIKALAFHSQVPLMYIHEEDL